MLTAINPANGMKIRTYEENSGPEVDDKVNAAHQAFSTWRETAFPQRFEKLRPVSKILINNKEEYAALMAAEMGKPIGDGRAEIEKCAWVCDFYADNALGALKPESIKTANDTAYGLGAAVFTRDVDHGEHIAAYELEAGNCFVNAFVKSDPRLPFGGIKQSGYGRELSHYGIKEFVNIKTVYVA
jgi:acyl-CoA reductase-like NAD-dependent aldehyde dehydrogenase